MGRIPDSDALSSQFARERERLVAALGMTTESGVVAWLEHVGATSVPGLLGQPCVDIALHVWPFPLENAARQALYSLGYELDPSFAGAPEQRFSHSSAAFHLHVVNVENGVWRYRRQPAIVRDASRTWLRSDDGIDYLAPELVLLFKSATSSGATREKDLADFDATYTQLEPERRAWLRWALTAVNPSHPWLDRL